jgi:uncharacterized protein (TIGR03437 family)
MGGLHHFRRFASTLGPVLALLLVVLCGRATGQSRELRIVSASGLPGQTVTVAVELVASGSENAVGFSLAWDPLQLGTPQVVIGSGLTGASINTNANNAAAGRLGVILALPANQAMPAGVRQLVRITFAVAPGQTGTEAPLAFTDQPVAREVVDTAANTLPTSYVDGRISLVMVPTLTATPQTPNSNDDIVVAVRGTWPDGCRPASPVVTRSNSQVTITTAVTATVCTQALTPYALDVPIGRLPRGLYTVELVHQTPLATLRLGTLPLTVIGGMVSANAGSYNLESVAAESIVAVFGTELATGSGAATTLPLPTTLAGTTLLVRDAAGVERPAPLFYVSPQQVNYQIPPGTAPGRASLTLTSAAGIVSVGSITVAGIAPGLFSLDGSGRGLAAAYVLRVKASGEVTGEQVWRLDAGALAPLSIDLGPASDQVFLVMFGTGFRSRTSLSAVTVTIGGIPAEVLYAGAAPDFVGLDQCNLRLDRQLIGRGTVDIEMMVDRLPANKVTITLK